MTGGQAAQSLDQEVVAITKATNESASRAPRSDLNLVVIKTNEEECAAHEALLDKMKASGECVWRELNDW